MNELYPLKFTPICKERIWGGTKIKDILKKDVGDISSCGESWEISDLGNDVSIVNNGFLKGNTLSELVEIYMGDLVGESVYDRFNLQFPLLIKFIDAKEFLSIQVHPNDEMAIKQHNSFGKTELWYIMDAEKDSKLISGFNKPINKESYLEAFNNHKLAEIVNFEDVGKGDVFYIPAGRIHSIGSGILLVEIQQISDITYRIYDWERKDSQGNSRELHTDLALEAIDYSFQKEYKTKYSANQNASSEILNTPYFCVNIIDITQDLERDCISIDSFIIYICIEGSAEINYLKGKETIKMGETILVPALIDRIILETNNKCKLLEVYIDLSKEISE